MKIPQKDLKLYDSLKGSLGCSYPRISFDKETLQFSNGRWGKFYSDYDSLYAWDLFPIFRVSSKDVWNCMTPYNEANAMLQSVNWLSLKNCNDLRFLPTQHQSHFSFFLPKTTLCADESKPTYHLMHYLKTNMHMKNPVNRSIFSKYSTKDNMILKYPSFIFHLGPLATP